ncbi:MAG: hypothetical protein ABI846_04205 [Rudaea sp.]
MNTSVATIIDTMRNASNQTAGHGLATIAEVVREALANRRENSEQRRVELNRWLIVLAAVAGALFLLRGMRKLAGLAFGLFWVWLFVGGNFHHLHLW